MVYYDIIYFFQNENILKTGENKLVMVRKKNKKKSVTDDTTWNTTYWQVKLQLLRKNIQRSEVELTGKNTSTLEREGWENIGRVKTLKEFLVQT